MGVGQPPDGVATALWTSTVITAGLLSTASKERSGPGAAAYRGGFHCRRGRRIRLLRPRQFLDRPRLCAKKLRQQSEELAFARVSPLQRLAVVRASSFVTGSVGKGAKGARLGRGFQEILFNVLDQLADIARRLASSWQAVSERVQIRRAGSRADHRQVGAPVAVWEALAEYGLTLKR
jgi:hypothetical protein